MISVTGGAKTFSLPPRLDLALRDGFERLSARGRSVVCDRRHQRRRHAVHRAGRQPVKPSGSPGTRRRAVVGAQRQAALRYGPDGEPVRGGFAFYGDPGRLRQSKLLPGPAPHALCPGDHAREGKFQGRISFRAGPESRISKLMAEGSSVRRRPSPLFSSASKAGPVINPSSPLFLFFFGTLFFSK
jgi:hypothetical protein